MNVVGVDWGGGVESARSGRELSVKGRVYIVRRVEEE